MKRDLSRKNDGLQNLYSPVRLRSAPPTKRATSGSDGIGLASGGRPFSPAIDRDCLSRSRCLKTALNAGWFLTTTAPRVAHDHSEPGVRQDRRQRRQAASGFHHPRVATWLASAKGATRRDAGIAGALGEELGYKGISASGPQRQYRLRSRLRMTSRNGGMHLGWRFAFLWN